MATTHLPRAAAARLATDPDFADDVRWWAELCLTNYGPYVHAAYGRDLAELLGVDLRGHDLAAAAREALAILDATVNQLVTTAQGTGAPGLVGLLHLIAA